MASRTQGLNIRREAKQFVRDMLNKAINAGLAWWYRMQGRYE